MPKINTKRILTVITAVLCIVVFTVLMFIARNPALLDRSGSHYTFDYDDDFIKFIDVGQGDSAFIYSNGYSAIIDMGIAPSSDSIIDTLNDCKINAVDMLIISHYHTDHIGGFNDVANRFEIKNMLGPKVSDHNIEAAQKAKEMVLSGGGRFYEAIYGLNFMLGEFKITVLGYCGFADENNRSVYLMAEIDGQKFLFTGDGELIAETELLKRTKDIDCDVLKVAHHGSKTSTNYEFLKAATPEYAVISVGRDNSYNHPHSESITALEKANAEIYRTDYHGDIIFYIENGEIEIKTEKTGDYY